MPRCQTSEPDAISKTAPGDSQNRYVSAKARKAYAGTAPITRASGLRQVVLARTVGNRRLSTACHLWAFAALTGSPGARRYYDAHRARGATHHQALRALANRLVGVLHGCLRHRQLYDEQLAWPTVTAATTSRRPPTRQVIALSVDTIRASTPGQQASGPASSTSSPAVPP